jgi:protein-S-isoprenylcysteine O-methyltransferase Ste14
MRRPQAAVGSAVFLALAPGIVAGVVPWLVTRWDAAADWGVVLRTVGWALVVCGGAVLVQAFARFVVEGAGTPAPVAPTERLVVGGLYRYVRNPMYLAVGATIVGQALVLGSWLLIGYAALFLAVVFTFVRLYEEPTLQRRYGSEYEAYRAAVPGWLPRLRPGE